MNAKEKAGTPRQAPPASKFFSDSLHNSTSKIHRRDFFRRILGRALTEAVLLAEIAGNDQRVNMFLGWKDRLNKRGAR